ncbi:MAG: hypothetical protein Q7J38_02005, partial [Gallionella sp.]|nr:hypothetical protein [Gallionella sp.]
MRRNPTKAGVDVRYTSVDVAWRHLLLMKIGFVGLRDKTANPTYMTNRRSQHPDIRRAYAQGATRPTDKWTWTSARSKTGWQPLSNAERNIRVQHIFHCCSGAFKSVGQGCCLSWERGHLARIAIIVSS